MKVSKREYRNRQNQATGYVVGGVFFILIWVLNLYDIINDDIQWSDFELSDWIIIIIYPLLYWRWRKEEKELKEIQIDE